MNPRFLLDTHVVVRWLVEPRKLSREQVRVLREIVRLQEPVALSAISLLEIAVLVGVPSTRSNVSGNELLLDSIEANPAVRILPLTLEVAREVSALGPSLRDPADRAIVATALVHRLRLMTSDERIVDSGLVPVVS